MGLEEAMKQVPLMISVSDREDETGLLADYVLPDHHLLGKLGRCQSKKRFVQSSTAYHCSDSFDPCFSRFSFESGAKGAGLEVNGLALRAKDWHEYFRIIGKKPYYKDAGSAGSFEQFWEGVLRAGVFDARAAHRDLIQVECSIISSFVSLAAS